MKAQNSCKGSRQKAGEKMGEVIVSMKDIVKTFPGVKALDHVNFELRSGEVMALLGENGAGKSTLMKILSGVYTKDSGTMTIFGTEYDNLTPKQAQDVGVAIIHQELNMCRHLSVAENMFLGREKVNGIVLNDREMEAEAAKILGDLKIDIDPRQTVGDLPVSKQQMVEIAKALSIHAKILIMDEPTSSLTAKEIEELFRIIRQLKADGCGIVYISHRLEELKAIVDRVTIMRDGQYITDGNFADMTMEQIIANMVGREIKEQFPRVSCPKGKKIFEVKNLNAGHLVRDINFSLYEGEIVGFAGLMGAGRTETTRAIFGVDPKTSGEIWLDGKEVFALDFPNVIAFPPMRFAMLRLKICPSPIMITNGRIQFTKIFMIADSFLGITLSNVTPLLYRRSVRSGSSQSPVL